MDPLHAWKDDFNREVEEVLNSRVRAQETGAAPSEADFGGRLADLVIPPAGAYAELRDALAKLESREAEAVELRERLAEKDRLLEKEREARERLQDGVALLTSALHEERAGRAQTQAEERAARKEAEAAGAAVAAARLDVEHAAARSGDWEREAMARHSAAREIQARLDRSLLDLDAAGAETSSLCVRLEAAARRATDSETELAAARAGAGSRDSLAARLEIDRIAAVREVRRLTDDLLQARDESVAAQVRERASAAALGAERERVQAEIALHMERAEGVRVEGERALVHARRLQAELPGQLDMALREERARLQVERETADREMNLAREARREASARVAESETAINEVRAVATREAREQAQTAYAQGIDAARTHAEHAERELENSRRAEMVAAEKARQAVAALAEYRDHIRKEIARLAVATKDDKESAAAALAVSRRSEAQALGRLAAEHARRDAALDEERARLRSEFEDTRARLEGEMNAERRALHERWKEQCEELDGLRKGLKDGRPGA
jgi:hypothetical protein